MTKYTTRIIYCGGNAIFGQYAIKNCKPFGTKWRMRFKQIDNGWGYRDEFWIPVGTPELLITNWEIDEKKVKKSYEFLIYECV